jgi:hypothetical protein
MDEPYQVRHNVPCSFCGKRHSETGPMVEGPNDVYMCAACVDTAGRIVARMRQAGELPGAPYPLQLQPLRVPAGWTVTYNDGLYEVDPPPDAEPDGAPRWLFKEDMLQMRHEGADRLLDVGWYPDGDVAGGGYVLVVYEGDVHGRLLHESRGRDRAASSPRSTASSR